MAALLSTAALLLVSLVQHSHAACKDYNSFTINSQTYNCFTAFDDFGIQSMCEDDNVNYLCCASCTPVNVDWKKMKAEGLFVLDKKSYELFTKEANGDEKKGKEQVKKDALFAITDANMYYDTLLLYGLDIDIYVTEIQVLDYDLVSGNEIQKDGTVNEDVLYDNFEAWLQTSAAALTDTKYDFAMLLSGHDIQDPTTGYAAFARMCQRGKAVGIMEFRGMPDDPATLAHEVGHMFSADHDPDGYDYVMSATGVVDVTTDKYKFSDISGRDIKNYLSLAATASNCLFETSSSSELPSLQPYDYTGNSQDIYYLCEREIGDGALPCLAEYLYTYGYDSDGVCREIYCSDLSYDYCTPLNPPEGLACGPGKSCRKGYCVDDPRPELDNVDPNCPLGEDPLPTGYLGETCESLIADEGPGECAYYSPECCITCPKYETGLKDCPYGDLLSFRINSENYDCDKTIQDFGKKETCKNDKDLAEWCCKTCHDLGY